MVLVHNYSLAIVFFALTMICWGSWPNTQKLAAKTWRFELFYWDMVTGLLLLSLLAAFTLGSMGADGRTFIQDLQQAELTSMGSAFLGGVVWNIGNLLLVAAIAVAGMAVGFPIGGGIAWVLGIAVNYFLVVMRSGQSPDNDTLLWMGVSVIVIAIYLSMISYKKLASSKQKTTATGIILSVLAGILIAFFYGLVVNALDPVFVEGGGGTLAPYSGAVFFALGAFLSTFIINPIFMARPVQGEPVQISAYFKGSFTTHLTGILGGAIWMTGMVLSFMAVGAAGPAISYALSNAAPVVAILWGVLVWQEFKGAPKGTNTLLTIMFVLYIIGLVLITMAKA
ncbi:MAG: multidrug DMT transporter permease [Cyclobacteriaceae bacterium]|nr:multidrug DMT transporter permease [Cyclobacteriaceae bacterium]